MARAAPSVEPAAVNQARAVAREHGQPFGGQVTLHGGVRQLRGRLGGDDVEAAPVRQPERVGALPDPHGIGAEERVEQPVAVEPGS
ncbi:hypothetical protein ACWDA3_20000 [Nonomuraea rubra]